MKYNLFTIINYAWKKVGYTKILAGFSVLVLLWYIVLKPFIEGETDTFFDFFDPILSFITASLAIVIWYNEMVERWEESLPKKLTVNYVYNNELVLRCEEAYLADQSDIRTWGQQIGNQMAGGNLNFHPFLKQKPRKLIKTDGQLYWLYEVFFFLRDEFKIIRKKSPDSEDENNTKQEILFKGYKLWQPGSSPQVSVFEFDERPLFKFEY